MEFVALEIEHRHLLIGYLDPLWIGVGVEFAADRQSGLGRGVGDELDHGETAGERVGTPVLGNVAEHAMLDLVPLRGAGGIMADLESQAGVVGKPLQFDLPKPQTWTI